MTVKLLSVIAGSAILLMTPAYALNLTNEDNVTYSVELIDGIDGEGSETFDLKNGVELENICEKGCLIKLNTGAEMEFTGGETAVIKDGEFVFAE